MIQINPLQSYIDGGARAAITTPPSASLVFDLPGKAIWVKGVKLKGTDHAYTFSHDNYISITNTPDQNNPESEDILIGINTTLLKLAIDTTYGIVNATTNGLAPMFSNANKASASAATTYSFLGIAGSTLKWYQLPWRNVRINTETSDVLGIDNTDPLIISSGNGIEVSWDSVNKRIVITNTKPDINHNTDTHVSQLAASDNADRPVILKQSANTENEVGSVRYTSTLLYNPSTKILKINNARVITTADIYVGATSSTDATAGLVPAATSAQRNYFLRGDGTWSNMTADTWRPIKVGGSEKLGSGTDTGAVDFVAGTGITLGWDATNKRITITNSAPDVDHNTDRTGIKKDTVSGTKKTDATLIVANSSSGLIFEGGTNLFKIGDGTNYVEIPVTPSFTVTDKSASILSSLTTLATIAGTDIKAKVVVDNKAATIGTTATTIATVAGVDITAKIGSYAASNHTHSVKINGSTKTIAAPGGDAVDLGSYLPLSGGTMSLGEGLKFHSDDNYFGTNLDARIISLLDGNGTTCDGGLIIDERATSNGTETITELLRIRDNEFKWKGAIIAHANNISNKDATLTTSLVTIATIAGVDIKAKITNYNTDENVKQTPKTDNVNRPLMMINGGTSAGELTSTSMFSTGIYANTSTKMITANGFIKTGFDDTSVLLAGGGAKALSDFLLSLPAHEHNKIIYLDTRNTIESPNDVVGFNGIQIHFKDKSKSLIPSSGQYTTIIYFDGYSDYTGGYPAEMGFSMSDLDANRPFYLRSPKSATEWGSWRKILDTGNSSVSGGGSTLGSSITVNLGGSSKTLTIPSSIDWSQLTSIPSSFNPSAHDHDGRYVKVYNNHTTNPNIDSLNTEFYLLGTDTLYGGGTKPANSDNAVGILNVCTHGSYYSQLALETTINRLYMRSAVAGAAYGSWAKVAFVSDIPSTYAWSSITSKPETATRWPSWSEVTNKPSTFPPSDHDHYRILPTRHDSNAPSPKTNGLTLTFLFSYFDNDWWNVLNMRSYGDYNYLSSLLLSPAGNPGSDIGYGDLYWRQGRQNTWIAKRKIFDDVNYTSYVYSKTLSDGKYVHSLHNASTNPNIDSFNDTAYVLTQADSGSWAGGAQPSGSHNGLGIINMHTHTGYYYSLLALDTNLNRVWIRSANNSTSWSGWARLAMASEIPTNTWRPITNSYTGSDLSTSVSQYGTNALYNALVNGYANESGRTRYVTCPDTRDTMPAPGSYTASTTGVSFDFKYYGVSGLSGAYYAGIMTVRPYAGGQDWSGGPAHQLAFNGDGRLLHRTGTSSWGSWVVVPQCDTSGNLTCTNFYTTSDRNKKTNISSFSEHIRKFQLKDTEKWHYGVIAQEVEEMFRDGEEGNMTVNYNSVLSFYIGLLENSVKMLEERIKRLESK